MKERLQMKTRTRMLATLVAVAMTVTMLPVSAGASGRTTAAASKRPALVQAIPTPRGVCVVAATAGPAGMDVYRSQVAGERGMKLTATPVRGCVYLDKAAAPGGTYYYTVRLAGKAGLAGSTAGASGAGATAPKVLPQVKSTAMKTTAQPRGRRSALPKASWLRRASRRAGAAKASRRAGVSASLVSAKTFINGPTTLTANTVWTPAMSPIVIRGGDLVVPAGVTLTIKPGTKIYFDVFNTGGTEGVDFETNQNPTQKCDLIVHGKLVANGLPTDKILFSSIYASIAATLPAPDPEIGDWGTLFFDSQAGSQISYSIIEFGEGVWAKGTFRPYLISNDIVNDNTDSFFKPYSAVWFEDVPAGPASPKVRIIGNRVASAYSGITVANSPMSGDALLDPIVTGNTVDATAWGLGLGVMLRDDATPPGNYTVRGTVSGNTVTTSLGGFGVELIVETSGTGSARLLTTMTANRITAPLGIGVLASAYTLRGAAEISPVMTSDVIDGGQYGFASEAVSDEDTVTNVGSAIIAPRASKSTFIGRDLAAVGLFAGADGAGPSVITPSFTGCTLETHGSATGRGVQAETYSQFGFASASPVLVRTTATSHAGTAPLIDCAASSGKGGHMARANPSITGGALYAGSSVAVNNMATSSEGKAETKARLVGVSSVFGRSGAINSQANSDDTSSTTAGGADASAYVERSPLSSSLGPAISALAADGGAGAAVVSPVVKRSRVIASFSSGLVLTAASETGPATCSPATADSPVYGGSGAVVGMATIDGPGGVANATAKPAIVRSPLTGTGVGLVLLSDNAATGNAVVSPTVSGGPIASLSVGAVLQAVVEGTGVADVRPTFVSVPVSGMSGGLLAFAQAPQATSVANYARLGGTFSKCSFDGGISSGVQFVSTGGLGAETAPTFKTCRFTSQNGDAGSFSVDSTGPAGTMVRNGTVLDGCSVPDSFLGLAFSAIGGDASSAETVLDQPRLLKTPVRASLGQAVYSSAHTDGSGSVRNETQIMSSPLFGGAGAALVEATSDGTADAVNVARIIGTSKLTRVQAPEGPGVMTMASSDHGNATESSQVKNLWISAGGSGLMMSANANGADKTGSASPIITGNKLDDKWGVLGNGIDSSCYGDGHAVSHEVVTGNRVTGAQGMGIQLTCQGSGTVTTTPVVVGNSVERAGFFGLLVDPPSGRAGLDSFATVTKNTVSKTGMAGIYVDLPLGLIEMNRISYAGYRQAAAMPDVTAGIDWYGSKGGLIRGNLIRECRTGICLGGYGPYPLVTLNDLGDATMRPGVRRTTLLSDVATPAAINAPNNWWGYNSSMDISQSISHPATDAPSDVLVDYVPWLTSAAPRLTGRTVVKSASKVKFTLKFDRRMDTSVKKLGFSKTAGKMTYKVTGAWSAGGTVWKGTRSLAGLPTGVWMYFAGAKDMPGNPMDSKSKKFKL
jgi:hypothetical protein